MNQLRRIWSLNKLRYQKDGYDLDLTYISDNIVAMCFPSVDLEALIRNPRDQVLKFLNQYHKNQYKLYNLCSEPEHQYDAKVFENRVSCFPFGDHQAPKFEIIEDFCKDLDNWTATKGNTAFIHCKAGKGRTGLMICCYLVWNRKMTANEAMDHYGEKRTNDGKGVTIPSQRRYVQYFYEYLTHRNPVQKLQLKRIRLTPYKDTKLLVVIENYKHEPIFDGASKDAKHMKLYKVEQTENKHVDITFVADPATCFENDMKIIIMKKKGGKPKKCMHFWVNTRFIYVGTTTYKKEEVDGPHKDRKKHKKYDKNFTVQVTFETLGGAPFFSPSLQTRVDNQKPAATTSAPEVSLVASSVASPESTSSQPLITPQEQEQTANSKSPEDASQATASTL